MVQVDQVSSMSPLSFSMFGKVVTDEREMQAERRAESVQSQADIWHRAAAALIQLQSRHSAGAETVDAEAAQVIPDPDLHPYSAVSVATRD